MRTRTIACMLVLGTAGQGMPQDKGQVGLNMAVDAGFSDTGAAIGATIHAGERFALRPRIRFSTADFHESQLVFERDGTVTSKEYPGSETSWSVGLSLLFYLARFDELSLYLAPGYERHQTTIEQAPRSPEAFSLLPQGTQVRNDWTAVLGLQYRLKERLSLYGEVGLRYQRGDELFRTRQKRLSAFNSGVGVIFYFNRGASAK